MKPPKVPVFEENWKTIARELRWETVQATHPWWESLLLGLAHLGLCLLGLAWRNELAGVSPVWPASGLCLYAVFRLGWRAVPALIGSKIAAALLSHYPLDVALATNLTDPLKAYAALIAWRWLPPLVPRKRPVVRLVAHFLLCCALLGLAGASIGGLGYLCLGRDFVWENWGSWLVGDTLGAAIVMPLLIRLPVLLRRGWVMDSWMLQTLGWNLVLGAAAILLFSRLSIALNAGFLLLPLLLWGALRCGLDGVILLNFTFTVGALVSLGANTAAHLPFMVALLFTGVGTSLVCASYAEEVSMRDKHGRRVLRRLLASNMNLRAQDKRMQSLLDRVPDAVLIHNAREVQYANRQVLGLRQKLLGKAAQSDIAMIRELLPSTEALAQEKPKLVQVPGREGNVLHLEARSAAIPWKEAAHQLLIIRDLTTETTTSRELSESEQRFSHVFQLCPESITIVSVVDGEIVEVNRAFERIFGYSRNEIRGRSIHSIRVWLDPEDRTRLLEEVEALGEVQGRVRRMRRRDGRLFYAELSANIIAWRNDRYLVTILADVSERRQLEEQRQRLEAQLLQSQKMEALGTLAGGIAHDFNNVLTAILGNTQLARMDLESTHPAVPALQHVRAAAESARQMVNRILSFSRRRDHNAKICKLSPMVQETLSMLEATLPPQVRLDLDLREGEAEIRGDTSELQQVLLNLCTNALHAMRGRGGVLKVALSVTSADRELVLAMPPLASGEYLKLSVKDSGCGMDAATLGRIFEPFFTTKSPGEGTGLGLAVAHGIIKTHRGSVSVSSIVGEGTVFSVYLPCVGERKMPQPTAPSAVSHPAAGAAILVVDDDLLVLGVLEMAVSRLGYVPCGFQDPFLMLETWEKTPDRFAAVLCDLNMPKLSGLEVAARVFAKRRIPFILLSGHLTEEHEAEAAKLGIHARVGKPIDYESLAEVLHSTLMGGERRT